MYALWFPGDDSNAQCNGDEYKSDSNMYLAYIFGLYSYPEERQ